MIIKNDKGFALITTLILSAIAMSFIVGLVYMTKSNIQSTTSVKTYKSSLAVGKGTSDFIIVGVNHKDIQSTSSLNDIQDFLDGTYIKETPGYTITVLDYFCEEFDQGKKQLYTFKIRVVKDGTDEKVEIDFGYLLTLN